MDKLPKRKKIRISGYNYSQNGVYFVTICTDRHKCILGNIETKDSFPECCNLVGANCVRPPEVNLSDTGKIIYNEIAKWNETYDFVSIDNFVIMPNHLHLLISIDVDVYGRTQCTE